MQPPCAQAPVSSLACAPWTRCIVLSHGLMWLSKSCVRHWARLHSREHSCAQGRLLPVFSAAWAPQTLLGRPSGRRCSGGGCRLYCRAPSPWTAMLHAAGPCSPAAHSASLPMYLNSSLPPAVTAGGGWPHMLGVIDTAAIARYGQVIASIDHWLLGYLVGYGCLTRPIDPAPFSVVAAPLPKCHRHRPAPPSARNGMVPGSS